MKDTLQHDKESYLTSDDARAVKTLIERAKEVHRRVLAYIDERRAKQLEDSISRMDHDT